MRLYVYQPGQPGYICAEVEIPERIWREVVDRGFDLRDVITTPGTSPTGELLRRDELLEVSTRRRALAAWERRDDTAFQVGWEAERREQMFGEVRTRLAEGCTEARRFLATDVDQLELDEYIAQHLCRTDDRRPLHLV